MKKLYPIYVVITRSLKMFFLMYSFMLCITSFKYNKILTVSSLLIFIGLLLNRPVVVRKPTKATSCEEFLQWHPILTKMSKQLFLSLIIIQAVCIVLAVSLTWFYARPSDESINEVMSLVEAPKDDDVVIPMFKSLPVPVQTYVTQAIILANEASEELQISSPEAELLAMEITYQFQVIERATKLQCIMLILLWLFVGAMDYPALIFVKYMQTKEHRSGGLACK